jgi:uncharacterized protein YneF (UPF0154 family)
MPNNPTNPTWIEPPPKSKSGLGCFAKGCLISVVVLVLLFAALLVGGYFTVRHVRNTYLATAPIPIPITAAAQEEILALKEQWKDFERVASRNETLPAAERQPAHLEYSATQINQLISSEAKAAGHVSVAISNGVMHVNFSIPTDALKKGKIDIPGISGRFVNGSVAVQTVGPTAPSQVVLSDAKLNGRSVPTSIFDTSYRGESLRSYIAEYSSKKQINTFQIVGDKVMLDSPGH